MPNPPGNLAITGIRLPRLVYRLERQRGPRRRPPHSNGTLAKRNDEGQSPEAISMESMGSPIRFLARKLRRLSNKLNMPANSTLASHSTASEKRLTGQVPTHDGEQAMRTHVDGRETTPRLPSNLSSNLENAALRHPQPPNMITHKPLRRVRPKTGPLRPISGRQVILVFAVTPPNCQ